MIKLENNYSLPKSRVRTVIGISYKLLLIIMMHLNQSYNIVSNNLVIKKSIYLLFYLNS